MVKVAKKDVNRILYNFIKVNIYKEDTNNEKKFIGCIHFFNDEELISNLSKELSYIEKEYGNISYEILK